jgi:hypothetical protein
LMLPSALGTCNGSAAASAAGDGAKDILCLPKLVSAIVPPITVDKFTRTFLPSKTVVPGSTPKAISAAGIPAAQIAGRTALWPSSTPLWPAAIAVIVILAAGVRRHCHHPDKPVQAGGVVDQVDPALAHQGRQGTPCNGAAVPAATVVWWGG